MYNYRLTLRSLKCITSGQSYKKFFKGKVRATLSLAELFTENIYRCVIPSICLRSNS